MKISDVEAAESGRSRAASPQTRTDSEARTRKGRFQVQVDSFESAPIKRRTLNKKEIDSKMGAALEKSFS